MAVEILWPLTSESCKERKVTMAWWSVKLDCPTQVSAQEAGLPEDRKALLLGLLLGTTGLRQDLLFNSTKDTPTLAVS